VEERQLALAAGLEQAFLLQPLLELLEGDLAGPGAERLHGVADQQAQGAAAEGSLFESSRKRKLPFLPRRIAVVTSPSGAAVHDFLRVLHRRFANLPS